jgi:hypothetical protein
MLIIIIIIITIIIIIIIVTNINTRWFKYDRDYLCVNKSQFVLVIFEPPCTFLKTQNIVRYMMMKVQKHA